MRWSTLRWSTITKLPICKFQLLNQQVDFKNPSTLLPRQTISEKVLGWNL